MFSLEERNKLAINSNYPVPGTNFICFIVKFFTLSCNLGLEPKSKGLDPLVDITSLHVQSSVSLPTSCICILPRTKHPLVIYKNNEKWMSTWFFRWRDFAVILVGHRRKTFLLFLFENYVLSIIQFKCTIIRPKLKDPNWKPNLVKIWIMVLRRDRSKRRFYSVNFYNQRVKFNCRILRHWFASHWITI